MASSHGENSPPRARATTMEPTKWTPPYGHDDASDFRAQRPLFKRLIKIRMNPNDISEDDNQADEQIENSQPLSHVPMPTTPRGQTTLAYERALLNRVPEPKLDLGGVYDMKIYKPTFIHNILMLPGSLANLIGKGSPEDIINRMTPALLPGVHAHIDSGTLQPLLVRSTDEKEYVQGMLIFGQGKEARNLIHAHYRQHHARRKSVEVEIEVSVPVQPEDRVSSDEKWRLERRTIWAHAWLHKAARECGENCPKWTLEDSLECRSQPREPLRIEADAKGDEEADGYIGRDIQEHNIEPEQREVVYAGSGLLEYDRASYFTGW